MYGFMNKHLHLGAGEIVEKDFKPLSKEEISVWDSDHPMPKSDEAAELKVVRAFAADSEKQLQELAKDQKKFATVLSGAWDILIGRGLPKKNTVSHDVHGDVDRDGGKEYRAILRYNGEAVPTVILVPGNWNRQVAIWLTDQGKAGLFTESGQLIPAVKALWDGGVAIAGLDLLYQGEFLKPGESFAETRRVNNPREVLAYTVGYNHPLFSQRVHDVLTMIAFARDHETQPTDIHLVGFGAAGLYAAAAAAQAGSMVKKLAVGTDGFRFASITEIRDPMLLPGAVKYGDVPGLLSRTGATPLFIAGEKLDDLLSSTAPDSTSKVVTVYAGKKEDAPAAAAKWLIG